MATIHFNVENALTEVVNENVLVFLMPVAASPNFQFAAWQSLNISPGGSEPFDYNVSIQVQAMRQDNMSTTPKVNIHPGELYDVVMSNLGGISLQKDIPNAGSLTPDQCGVMNNTSVLIKTLWYVNGNPCVAMPELNQNSTSIFELEPSIYFRAATPTQQGFNYTLQQVSAETPYVIPATATTVQVTWSRDSAGGADEFSFDPPSEQIPPQTVRKAHAKEHAKEHAKAPAKVA